MTKQSLKHCGAQTHPKPRVAEADERRAPKSLLSFAAERAGALGPNRVNRPAGWQQQAEECKESGSKWGGKGEQIPMGGS